MLVGNFKMNPKFKPELQVAFTEFTQEYFKLAQKVINESRLWDNWETSNPFRDIVDTGDLSESGTVNAIAPFYSVVSWVTDYVTLVYFGYALSDGRRIPSRKWADVAIQENDLLLLFATILVNRFTKAR